MTTNNAAPETFDTYELQARVLYACIVAGKSARFANRAFCEWLAAREPKGTSPFDLIRAMSDEELAGGLRAASCGNYTKLTKAFRALADSSLDLATCTPEDLEAIHGIGPKTSRFFILWTRPDASYAALDRHVLAWLRDEGYDAPFSTPTGACYAKWEAVFLEEARKRGKTARELDSEIWDERSGAANVVERPTEGVVHDASH